MNLHAAAYEKGEGAARFGQPLPLVLPAAGERFFWFFQMVFMCVRAGFVGRAFKQISFSARPREFI